MRCDSRRTSRWHRAIRATKFPKQCTDDCINFRGDVIWRAHPKTIFWPIFVKLNYFMGGIWGAVARWGGGPSAVHILIWELSWGNARGSSLLKFAFLGNTVFPLGITSCVFFVQDLQNTPGGNDYENDKRVLWCNLHAISQINNSKTIFHVTFRITNKFVYCHFREMNSRPEKYPFWTEMYILGKLTS